MWQIVSIVKGFSGQFSRIFFGEGTIAIAPIFGHHPSHAAIALHFASSTHERIRVSAIAPILDVACNPVLARFLGFVVELRPVSVYKEIYLCR